MSQPSTQRKGTVGSVYDLSGALHRIVLDGDSTGGAASVVEVTVLPGAGTPMHSDEREDLVWYVMDGALEFHVDEGTKTAEAGTSVFLPRRSIHGFVNTSSTPATALMIATPSGIETFFSEAAAVLPPGVPQGPPPPEAMSAFAELAARHGITLHGVPG